MTHGRLSPAQQQLADILGPLDGARLPGGCDECSAVQTVAPSSPGVWLVRVYHDDWCPFLARLEGASHG